MHRIFHSVTYIMPRKLRFCRKKNWEIQKQAKQRARQREDQITDVRTEGGVIASVLPVLSSYK